MKDRFIMTILCMLFRYFPTKDSVDIFAWVLASDTKEIMSYNCQKAITNHYKEPMKPISQQGLGLKRTFGNLMD